MAAVEVMARCDFDGENFQVTARPRSRPYSLISFTREVLSVQLSRAPKEDVKHE